MVVTAFTMTSVVFMLPVPAAGAPTYQAPDREQSKQEHDEAERMPLASALGASGALPADAAEAAGLTDGWWDTVASIPNVSVLTFSNGLRASDRNAVSNALLQEVRHFVDCVHGANVSPLVVSH